MAPSTVSTWSSRLFRPASLIAILLIVAALVPAPRAAQAAPAASGHEIQARQTVPLTPAPCPVPSPEGIRVDCGYLTVAESRRNYTGKTIQLAVAIVRSPNPNKAADPVVFLAGGPGQAAVPFAPVIPLFMGPTLAQRDIILIDQRGTGFSKPALNCSFGVTTLGGRLPIGMKQANDRTAALQFQVDALKACGDGMRKAGIDLRAYNSVENAADLEDLRRALGLGAWNVYGGSYGTRLALTAMQYRPETLRSVVIESVYPLQVNIHVDNFQSFDQTLSRLFAECAADQACNTANPNVGARYDEMVPRLNANPAQIPIVNLDTGALITYIPVTGVDVVSILFQLSYITDLLPILPSLITETASGNYRLLTIILSALLTAPPQEMQALSLGMLVAVQCNEEVTFASANDFVIARNKYPRAAPLAHNIIYNEAMLEVCAAWGLTNPDPADNRAVRSDVPTLVINGTLDPVTPPQFATLAAETLSRSQVVIYPRGGHTPSGSSPCLGSMIGAYYNNPAVRPDDSCIAQEAPRPFIIPD